MRLSKFTQIMGIRTPLQAALWLGGWLCLTALAYSIMAVMFGLYPF